MAFVHPSATPWLTGSARPRPRLALSPHRTPPAPARRPARRARVTATGISSWKPAFEAAVLNTAVASAPASASATPSSAPPTAEAPAATKGLTAARLRRLLRVTKRLSMPFFERDRTAKWHALACALFSVLESALGAVFTLIIGNLFTALNERNTAAFWNGSVYMFALCVVLIPLASCGRFTRSTFVLRWQQFLTKSGLRMYFRGRNYYKLNGVQKKERGGVAEDGLDNPDEVIHQQFAEFASSMVDFVLTNLKTVVDIALYSVILLQIFPPLYFVIIVIVALGTLLINRIGKRLFDLQALLLRRTADFRFALARIRMHAESIAFYDGSEAERSVSERKLDGRACTVLDLSKTQFPMNMFTNSFYFLPVVLPLLILGPLYFNGRIPLGDLTKAESAFSVLFNNLSLFIADYDQYTWLGASIERLSGFIIKLESNLDDDKHEFNLEENKKSVDSLKVSMNGTPRINTIEDASTRGIELSNVSVYTPCGSRRLIHNLSMEIKEGERVLIVGRSGSGKTSLLRALAGLWEHGTGTIRRPPRTQMMFLPQRTYSPMGSLREQLEYPKTRASSEKLEQALQRVGLGGLTGGLESETEWEQVLSAGEMQRLAVARAVVGGAMVVVVDEGTAGLDRDGEGVVMKVMREMGCTVVSVGHRGSLVKEHDKVVVVGEGGEAQVVAAKEFAGEGMC